VAVEPEGWRRPAVVDAVLAGGGRVVPSAEADALVWVDPAGPAALADLLARGHSPAWIQLPFADISGYRALLDDRRTWTCGKGIYAAPVAEHALALALAGLRGLHRYRDAGRWIGAVGRSLTGGRVTILGGGGIARVLVDLLEPFGCEVTVVRRRPEPLAGATVVTIDGLREALGQVDVVFLALALTPETVGIIGEEELRAMRPDAWLVNVARGRHVDTSALARALDEGWIEGAALDVTDPDEPLPDDHPLWEIENCIITPHVGNTPQEGLRLLAGRVEENVRRFRSGRLLLGVVDVEAGY
jgi:phosphoglycerate dehydrogenase-like enzyme